MSAPVISLQCAAQVTVGGNVFKVGDTAYVVCDTYRYNSWIDKDSPADGLCDECGYGDTRRRGLLYECDFCLRNFHIKCLDASADDPEEADPWRCSHCAAGSKPPENSRAQAFLFGRSFLGLGEINSLWQDAGGHALVRIQWYTLPKAAGMGAIHALNCSDESVGISADWDKGSVLKARHLCDVQALSPDR
jgi:hypothetical protein